MKIFVILLLYIYQQNLINSQYCSSNVCLNNGKCNNLLFNNTLIGFNCSCPLFYNGSLCQNCMHL
jgi:hypothetical protein